MGGHAREIAVHELLGTTGKLHSFRTLNGRGCGLPDEAVILLWYTIVLMAHARETAVHTILPWYLVCGYGVL